MNLFILLLTTVRTLASFASAYYGNWNHQTGQPFCTPTGPGVCNFGWEFFWDKEKKQHGSAAWVYDRYCNVIGDYRHEVPGYLALQPGPGMADQTKSLYHIQTPSLRWDVLMTDVMVDQTILLYPIFEYGGKKSGGKKGCSCGWTGLDKNGSGACQCAFDC